MRLRSSDPCQTDIYTLQCMHRTNIDDISLTVIKKQTCSWKCDANLTKSLNRNKNCSWQPYVLAKQNEMKKLYRGPYIDASCKVWHHLAKQFQRRRFFNISQSENNNCSWWPCLLAEWNQTKRLYRGSYLDASCQVWFKLAKEFQRRRCFLTLANQKQELLLAAIFVGQTERNEETL